MDLKTPRDRGFSLSVEKPFHTLAPLYEKIFCPTVDFHKGSLKSVTVFRTLRSVKCEFLVKVIMKSFRKVQWQSRKVCDHFWSLYAGSVGRGISQTCLTLLNTNTTHMELITLS